MGNKKESKKNNTNKKMVALGVGGFLVLTAAFFFVGFLFISPLIQPGFHGIQSNEEQTGDSLPMRPIRTREPYPTTTGNEEEQERQPSVEIRITERDDSITKDDEEMPQEGVRQDENSLTITLEPGSRSRQESRQRPSNQNDRQQNVERHESESSTEMTRYRTPPPGGRVFRVQAGAFANKENADNMTRDLNARGYKSEISEVKSGDSTLYRIHVGRFNSQEDAQELANDLTAHGFQPSVVAQ